MQLVIDVCFSSTTPQVSARTAEEAIQSCQVKTSQVKSRILLFMYRLDLT